MCGIFGYIGNREAKEILVDGIKMLEYRGYDSIGFALSSKNRIEVIKNKGRIFEVAPSFLKISLEGKSGISHTRWATHGKVNKINAHPHWDCKREIFVVHNGIIENYRFLKEKLEKEGHKFLSETDTEVIPHLIEKYFQENLEEATRKALQKLKGAWAIAVISQKDPGKIVVARNSSPLLIGLGRGENFVASDATALIKYTKKVIYLEDGEIGIIFPEDFKIITLENNLISKKTQLIDWGVESAQKQGFPHFMLKEIYEEPDAIRNALRGRIIKEEGQSKFGGLDSIKEKLRETKRIIIVGCGTSYYAGLVGKYMLEEYAEIPTQVEYASEFRYKKSILDENTLLLAISQSGETADTIAAVREANKKGVLTLGIVNVVGSTISRETKAGIYNHAGPEIGVASTKAFSSQLAILALLTVYLGRQRKMSLVMGKRILEELEKIPQLLEKILKLDPKIKRLAKKYKNYQNFLYLGRKYNYPTALEGALKLKEISYLHAEAYPAGEIKHGPIALIDKNFPTFAIALSDSVYEKIVSNLEEIKARQGKIIALATRGNKKIEKLVDEVFFLPKTLEMLSPILVTLPLHLFAYHVGVLRGLDVDKPRNLAKSVTVE